MAIHFPDIPATFRNIPRTGTTSFKFWTRANIYNNIVITDSQRADMLDHLSLDEIKERWPNYGTTFCFVRNPYDRLVSIFHFVGQQAKKRLYQRANPNNLSMDDLKNTSADLDLKILLQYRRGFKHWITTETNSMNYAESHLLNNKDTHTQMFFLNDVIPDIVVKLENINQDFSKIQTLLNCDKPFMHVNTSIHGNYSEYYDDETRKIAYKWLEQDLDAFEYTF